MARAKCRWQSRAPPTLGPLPQLRVRSPTDSWRTAAGHTLVVLVPSSPIALRLTRGGKLSISASSDTGSCASLRPLHGGQCLRISSEDASTSCGQNHVATSCPNTAHCLFCHGEGHQTGSCKRSHSPVAAGPPHHQPRPTKTVAVLNPCAGDVVLAVPLIHRPAPFRVCTPPNPSPDSTPEDSPSCHIIPSPNLHPPPRPCWSIHEAHSTAAPVLR
jgi:hypothetical protein